MTTRITTVRILFLPLAILCLTLTHRAQAGPNPIEGMLGGRVASGAPVEQVVSVGNGRICAIKPNGILTCWLVNGPGAFISEMNGITAIYCRHKMAAQSAMHLICTAARNDAVFLAYRVAMPRQRLRCRNEFSTKCRCR